MTVDIHFWGEEAHTLIWNIAFFLYARYEHAVVFTTSACNYMYRKKAMFLLEYWTGLLMVLIIVL